MGSGGSRPGAGRKPGTRAKKKRLKPEHLKRVRQQISLPRWVIDKLKKDGTNISAYVLTLILLDTEWEIPDWEEEPEMD